MKYMNWINIKLQEIANIFKDIDFTSLDGHFVVPVGEICEKLNINIIFADLPNGQSGYFENNTIYVNDNYSATRNLFTVAQELGHFIIKYKKNKIITKENRFDSKKEYTEEKLKEEREANSFAAELLMPASIFKEKFLEFKENYKKIAGFFGVSQSACEYRAINLGLADSI